MEFCRKIDAGRDNGGRRPREHDDLERWRGGGALPWHRADLGFFGAHALSRCARVARMDSCGPLLATHFLREKQVVARRAVERATGPDLCEAVYTFNAQIAACCRGHVPR